MTLPRISLVTPVFNSAKYIEQTIQSVLGQNYRNLEYFIVDGGSTDGTIDIIRKYESQISGWLSEPDNGMYEALSKGFARTSGEIMGWISATDQLHTGGLAVVGSVFRDLTEVAWITGRPTGFSEEGMTVLVLDLPRWSRSRFLAGANRYIQQESTFWRRSLWEKAGSQLDCSQRVVGDFDLWLRFFRHAKLYSVDALIGGYRVHAGQLSFQDMEGNHRIHDEYIEAELNGIRWGKALRFFRRVSRAAGRVPKVRGLWQRVVINGLYRLPGGDWPPVIKYDQTQEEFVLSRE
jgi:glycosyltransferase involved in cell wall biosynthesis